MALIVREPIAPRRPVEPPKTRSRRQSQPPPPGHFDALLRQFQADGRQRVNFSAHAEARLRERGIQLSGAEMRQLQEAVDKVEQKGARESLVLLGDLAFVVNVRGRNVITVLDGDHMRERVFTNIDSAIIVNADDSMNADGSNRSTGQALL